MSSHRWPKFAVLAVGLVLCLGHTATAQPRRTDEPKSTLLAGSERPLPARSTNRTASSSSTPRSPSSPVTVWGTLAALAVLAVGAVFASQWVRRHGPTSLRPLPGEAVEPLGQRILSRGVSVHLVRCGSRMLVLGVGPDGVRTLSEITDPIEVDLLAGACRRRDESATGRPAFARLFPNALRTSAVGNNTPRPRRATAKEAADDA